MKGILWFILGVLTLSLSILGGSLIGPTSNMLDIEASWIKTQWTYALRFIYCFPLAVIEAICTKGYLAKLK